MVSLSEEWSTWDLLDLRLREQQAVLQMVL
jgi:hypothetical protein